MQRQFYLEEVYAEMELLSRGIFVVRMTGGGAGRKLFGWCGFGVGADAKIFGAVGWLGLRWAYLAKKTSKIGMDLLVIGVA